jgi:hypothetical protein
MKGALQMLNQMTFEDISSATSSQESADGLTLYALPVGPTINPSGLEVARVSRSVPVARVKANQTSAIYGLPGSDLFAIVGRMQFFKSKLSERLPSAGLTMYAATWKEATTPAGRPYCRLVVSALRNRGRDYTLLRSPLASDWKDRGSWGDASIQRRILLGKQIGLSMLFQGAPCPWCVAGIMGFPPAWLSGLQSTSAMQSSRRSPRNSSKQQGRQ